MTLNRREFHALSASLSAAALTGSFSQGTLSAMAREDAQRPDLQLCTFRFDVSPPMGHSLCGGWIKPVVGYDDPLEAIGYVLLGLEKPIVVCVVDWTGILNGSHLAWRTALAEAAGTTPDRVAVHCVHQHNAPFACLDAQQLVAQYKELPAIVDVDFHADCLRRGSAAVREALKRPQRVTHLGQGEGRVEKVAGNRRILGPDGTVRTQRGSSSKNPEHHKLPEGLIDPMLKTVAFYAGDKKIAAMHYYACHPMSYYGDGRVSADFCGLARRKRQQDEPDCVHMYFNGCGGNIGAGKYNDGSKEMRPVLRDRIYQGICRSEDNLTRAPIGNARWSTVDVLPPPNPVFDADAIRKALADSSLPVVARNRPSYTLAWINRFLAKKQPIVLSSLQINDASMLHLPSECFIEYQLAAQRMKPDGFVAVAAYGDGGPWYIPTKDAYPQGGYAVSVAFCDQQIEDILTRGTRKLLS